MVAEGEEKKVLPWHMMSLGGSIENVGLAECHVDVTKDAYKRNEYTWFIIHGVRKKYEELWSMTIKNVTRRFNDSTRTAAI